MMRSAGRSSMRLVCMSLALVAIASAAFSQDRGPVPAPKGDPATRPGPPANARQANSRGPSMVPGEAAANALSRKTTGPAVQCCGARPTPLANAN